MNITEFLEARIAEDEEVARAAASGPWVYQDVDSVGGGRVCDPTVEIASLHYEQPGEVDPRIRRTVTAAEADGTGSHIARFDPARVLAECAAKRAIVEMHNLVPQTYATSKNWDGPDVGCSICAEWDGLICGEGPCYTLCALAAVYDQHPDYDPAWRP